MSTWGFAVGNLVSRAPAAAAAVAPATEDSERFPLSNLGNGQPADQAAFAWRADGAYAAELDLNLLAASSERVNAPTGWEDLLLKLAGTPGLGELPPDWGTYDARTALRIFRPIVQDIEVMPGETLKLQLGLELPGDSDSVATAARVTVTELESGDSWEAGTGWQPGGVAGEQTAFDAWLDVDETVTWNTAWTNRRTYRVVLEPVVPSDVYDAGSFIYASTPALFAGVDLVAVIGHNLPEGAMIDLEPQPSGTPITLEPLQPSFMLAAGAAVYAQVWQLVIQMPAGAQPRPLLGELWVGSTRAWDRSPRMDGLGYQEGDASQLRVEAAGGRLEVLSDRAFPPGTMGLRFRVPEADYVRTRDGIMRLTAFGTEPILVIPTEAFEGARFYHGRVGAEIRYDRLTAADSEEDWREFTLAFAESPFPAP